PQTVRPNHPCPRKVHPKLTAHQSVRSLRLRKKRKRLRVTCPIAPRRLEKILFRRPPPAMSRQILPSTSLLPGSVTIQAHPKRKPAVTASPNPRVRYRRFALSRRRPGLSVRPPMETGFYDYLPEKQLSRRPCPTWTMPR